MIIYTDALGWSAHYNRSLKCLVFSDSEKLEQVCTHFITYEREWKDQVRKQNIFDYFFLIILDTKCMSTRHTIWME